MKKGLLFKFVRVIFVLVLAVVIAVLLVTLRPKAERQVRTETRPVVEVLPTRVEKANMIIEGYGTVKPGEALKLVAEVRGQIVFIDSSFKEGGFIKKGTTLIKIDPRTYQLQVERQRIQIKQTDAELRRLQQEVRNIEASIKISKSEGALTKAEFLRLTRLSGRNVVARTTLDQAEQKYLSSLERLQGLENQMALTNPQKEQLQAQRDMLTVMLRQAKLDLERTGIVASFNGWVMEKGIEEGEHVTAGQYLGRVYSEGALEIEVRIPLEELQWFPPELTQDNLPEVEVSMNSMENIPRWKGRVVRFKAQMDEKTRTLPLVVEVNAPIAKSGNHAIFYLRPGMFVNLRIKGREIPKTVILPRHVVHDGNVVYVVHDNRLRLKPVSVLRRFKDSIFIASGLSDGELVVKTPLSGASEGMLVRLKNENK